MGSTYPTHKCKVSFALEKRTLGEQTPWPPCETESLWGELTSPHSAKLLNVPFFATNASYLDEVSITEATLSAGTDPVDAGPNVFDFVSVVHRSGHGTVRAVLRSEEGREKAEEAISALERLGCTWESAEEPGFSILSIDVPAGVAQDQVMAILERARVADAIYVDVGFLPALKSPG